MGIWFVKPGLIVLPLGTLRSMETARTHACLCSPRPPPHEAAAVAELGNNT